MKALRLLNALVLIILSSFTVFAYGYAYFPYGDYTQDYSHSYTTEQVSVRESERESSSNNYAGRYYQSTDNYDYGRSRDFAFSRTSDYESTNRAVNAADYPARLYARDYSTYSYPYYDAGTEYGRNYRPYYDSYETRITSPYENPYRYSRTGAYMKYLPYGY